MTDIRRTVLWMVFTASLVLLWDGWQKYNGHPSMFSPTPAKPAASAAPAPGSAASAGLPTASGTGTASAAAAPAAAASAAQPAGEKFEVTTDVVKATFDTRGGSLVRVELLKHLTTETHGLMDPLMRLVGLKAPSGFKPEPVVLFDAASYRPESGLIGVPGAPNHFTLMNVVGTERQLKDGASSLTVRFESPEQGGLKLVKTYTFKRSDYAIDVKHEVVNTGAAPVSPQLYVQLVRPQAVESSSGYMAPASFIGPAIYTDKNKFQKFDFKDLDKGKADYDKHADDGWVAMVQHYFTTAWLRNSAGPREFFVKKNESGAYSVGQVFPLPAINPGASGVAENVLYAGPQEENKLTELAPGLERVKDYGMFYVIAKPLFWLLDKIHGMLGNWGWSIVALVVLLKIAFFGLNASAYRSMAKMKAVGPRINELRERYKNDPQKQQQEMMRIYREEKVNPLGSCLPMLLQMPFFIALYWVLQSTVEMRNAPWIGWITDLSSADPFLILPILMTASSLLQVALNPTPADPTQAKMMWMMPLALSFMFFFFPAGLVLYWLVNNLLSIAQQWIINKQMGVQN